MNTAFSLIESLHMRGIDISAHYKKAEAELIDVIQQLELHRVFVKKGYSSLFNYTVQALRLSESVAFNMITVARKAKEVPELKTEIKNGTITLSNARKIAPVLNSTNKTEWLEKARTLSLRNLEKEVVKVRPELATPERARYVSPTHVKLEVGLSEKEMLRLRQVQNLLSQKHRRAVSLEEVISMITSEFLHRHDPVEKAKLEARR